jgi:Tfp pilus assembly protein PilV
MKINWQKAQKGETLIEALAALAIISIVVTAVANVVTTSLSNAQYNENQTLATKYAQQGIESMRQIRNQSYTAFRTANGTYCFAKGQTNLGSATSACTTENVDTFIRSVDIEQTPGCAPNVARVTVTVAFKDGKCTDGSYCHRQVHSSCLSTINPVQGL